MTTAQAVGAVSREAAEWYAIDWQTINRNVRRLHVRIVQATKASRWGKVRALQHLLTHSYQRQSSRRPTSDGKQWQGNPWCGPRNLGHTRKEDTGRTCTRAKGLSTPASSTCLHPEIGRQNDAPARNSRVSLKEAFEGLELCE